MKGLPLNSKYHSYLDLLKHNVALGILQTIHQMDRPSNNVKPLPQSTAPDQHNLRMEFLCADSTRELYNNQIVLTYLRKCFSDP